ncbi:MAG: hypothetical protein B7Z73_13655 [Planctomycetia bacterium 21-64-5]|nr:MAG: hypothetical protein B7Z73_13655 [Planctomycetia bacterium 21-64-5]
MLAGDSNPPEAFAMRLAFALVFLLPSVVQAQLHIAAMTTHGGAKLRIGTRTVGDVDLLDCIIERYEGDWAWIHNQDGQAGWVKRGDVVPMSQAIGYFTRKIGAEPRNGEWYHWRAGAWRYRGELDLALADENEAIRFSPSEAGYWSNRGNIYADKKDYDRALADYNQALHLNQDALYWYNAWSARHKKGDYEKALSNCDRAISLDPKYALAFNGRAWTWATARDSHFRNGQKAIDSARRACELSDWQEAEFLDTLAAAYAEAGDFDNAVRYQKQATGLLPADAAVRRPDFAEHLRLFESGKPLRE